MSLMVFVIASCSKNATNQIQNKEERAFFPKTISLKYSSGENSTYNFSYNAEEQISLIDFQRNDGDILLISKFLYNVEGQLTKVITENIMDATHYDVSFEYDSTDGTISDIALISSGAEKDLSIFYLGGEVNSYQVDGELGNLPTAWAFDADDNLQEMVIAETNISLENSNTDKGIFYHVNTQPAVHVWHGLLFYLSIYELYHFSKKDINLLRIEDANYTYLNKAWDEDGNLVSFQINNPPFLMIENTVVYEQK